MNPIQTTSAPTLTIRRTFAATRARVFAAWSDAALLRQWFPPEGRLTSIRWEPRAGATFRITMIVSNGEEWAVSGAFSEVLAPERLAFTFRWEEDDPALEHETFVSVELLERGNETEMVFTHTGFRSDESRDGHNEGWNMSFDNLSRTLSQT
jgi:uncharacterized protein YndB with AHSA1/START domain